MTPNMLRYAPPLLLLAILLLVAGCGGGDGLDRREVRGTVTVGGKPIQNGSITLFPLNEGPVASAPITEGEYVIEHEKGPIPGEYQVEIVGTKATGNMLTIEVPGQESREVPEVVSVVPLKYNEMSVLTMTVGPEDEVVEKDFELEAQ